MYAGVFDLGWHVPIQLDALYEVFPNLAVGVYGSYGVGEPDEAAFDGACAGDPRFDCSASVARAGAQAIYSLRMVSPRFVPWVGLGFGYEWATARAKASGDSSDLTVDMSGFELDLQLGAEYVVSERFAIGPYLTYAFGQYGDPSNAGALKGIAVVEEAVHTWFMIGLRGSLRL